MKLTTILATLRELLNDANYGFWTRAFLISAINEAVANIVRIRKDAGISIHTIPAGANPILLPKGTQSIITIQSITYEGKKYAAKQIDKKTLDQTTPNWTTKTGEPEFYVYELEKPTELWFYPALSGSADVQISKIPNEIPIPEQADTSVMIAGVSTDINDLQLDIDISYQTEIINYAMFRALSKESTSQKGDVYYKLFTESLGIKTSSDVNYQKQDKRQDNN